MKNLIVIAAALLLASCAQAPKDKRAELEELKKERTEISKKIAALEAEIGGKQSEADLKEVAVTELLEAPFKNYLEVQGKVDAEENVQVTPEMPGSVTGVFVKVGQTVSRGQVLAQLDDKVLRQNIAQLQTQLDLATTMYNRQKNLWDQKIGTEVQFLTAKTQMESLQKQIAVLKSQADMYKVKAPISGSVDEMELKIGQAISPGMPSGIRIVNANDLKVKAQVAESYASRVNQGDKVQISLPDVPDSIRTTLSFVSKVIDPISRSFNVEVKLPSRKSYRPNMLAILRIVDYENSKAITVPVNSIQKSESSEYVFVADGGKAKRVNITTGKVSDGKAEVLSGLKAGDKVITAGLQDLNEGDSLKM